MEIKINDNRTLSDVQKEFNEQFSFLKIEFFHRSHTINEALPKNLLRDNHKTIGESRSVHKNGHITIFPEQKVYELEAMFQDVYGLSVQVFRKSGKVWLETTSTDDWTLEKQNNEGKELSTPSIY